MGYTVHCRSPNAEITKRPKLKQWHKIKQKMYSVDDILGSDVPLEGVGKQRTRQKCRGKKRRFYDEMRKPQFCSLILIPAPP